MIDVRSDAPPQEHGDDLHLEADTCSQPIGEACAHNAGADEACDHGLEADACSHHHSDGSSQSCGGKPDPAGVCAVRGCTPGDMDRCATEGDTTQPEARWHIPARPTRDSFPPP